ncbi:Fe(2+)/2-oxoglutarate-dependent oxygenase fmaF [Aspergillus undulatus]|uniref:Fe(2+)/2-oxoglutarate-dependent oxygenase fmaF n=1 Tax=Aspergillus undulatus TaxID=1810928 RepID=UPI003CCD2F1E
MAIPMQTLDAAALAVAKTSLDEDGYAIIPSILDTESLKLINTRLWAAAEANQKRGADLYMPALDSNSANIRIFYLMELDSLFRELIQHPAALEVAKLVLPNGILVSNFTANIARPGSGSMKLHSDQSLVVPGPWEHPWGVNIIWCLSDVYFENGATLFIPGSHKWKRNEDVPPLDKAKGMLKPFVAKAGSIVAMDARVWHTSGANVTEDQERASLLGSILRDSVLCWC